MVKKVMVLGLVDCIAIASVGGIMLASTVTADDTKERTGEVSLGQMLSERSGITPKTDPIVDTLKNPEVIISGGMLVFGSIGTILLITSNRKTTPPKPSAQ